MGMSIWDYYVALAGKISDGALRGINSLAEWQAYRSELYRRFMRSVGLDCLPERCDLSVTPYGEFTGRGYRVRKLAYRMLPDCWATGSLYLPDPLPAGKLPTVLYLCGHAAIGEFSYQAHAIMWARRGYACFVLNTIEQSDNPGVHFGILPGLRNDWISLGYCSLGGELWNSIRALDMLETLPQVDADRIGATGCSGGGTMSFFLGLADERVKLFASVAGVNLPKYAIKHRVIRNACDCGYYHNFYQLDTSEFAALMAPRAALFGFASDDGLFCRDEYHALVDRARKVYRLYGCEDKCQLCEYPGPHGYQLVTMHTINDWFDTYVAGSKHRAMSDDEAKNAFREGDPPIGATDDEYPERITAIFNGRPPSPHRLDQLPELLSPTGAVELPQGRDDWPGIRDAVKETLRSKIFHLIDHMDEKLDVEPLGSWVGTTTAVQYKKYQCRLGGMDVWVEIKGPAAPTGKVIVVVAGAGENAPEVGNRVAERAGKCLIVRIEPRGGGFTSCHPANDQFVLRAGVSAGVTPTMLMVHDLHHVMKFVHDLPFVRGQQIYLYGRANAGVACLYHAIFDEKVAGVVLDTIPVSHRRGGYILGILRVLDMDHALGLIAPRPLGLVASPTKHCSWVARVYARLDCSERLIVSGSLTTAVQKVLATKA